MQALLHSSPPAAPPRQLWQEEEQTSTYPAAWVAVNGVPRRRLARPWPAASVRPVSPTLQARTARPALALALVVAGYLCA